jgi:hypothetical protein
MVYIAPHGTKREAVSGWRVDNCPSKYPLFVKILFFALRMVEIFSPYLVLILIFLFLVKKHQFDERWYILPEHRDGYEDQADPKEKIVKWMRFWQDEPGDYYHDSSNDPQNYFGYLLFPVHSYFSFVNAFIVSIETIQMIT